MDDWEGGHSPGPAGGLGGSSENDGLTGGTKRPCRHSDEPHTRPENAGRGIDTGRSPSAALVGESHTQETSEVVENQRKKGIGDLWFWVKLQKLTYLDSIEDKRRGEAFFRLTCCFRAAVVICGKTFTVTQQDDEESSTTTAKLSDRIKQQLLAT